MINTHDDRVCLPSWHHGKQRKLSCESHGMFLSDFCWNPLGVITVDTTYWGNSKLFALVRVSRVLPVMYSNLDASQDTQLESFDSDTQMSHFE